MDRDILPTDGFPKTRKIPLSDGTQGYIITPRVLTPLRVRVADALAALTTPGLGYLVYGIGTTLLRLEPGLVLYVVFSVFWLFYLVLRFFCRLLLKKQAEFRMSKDRFSVKTLFGWRHFDRNFARKYKAIKHDELDRQQGKLELKKLRGQPAARTGEKVQLYRESAHLVYEYSGQRYDILSIYGLNDAESIAARLRFCDADLDGEIAHTPSEQWPDDEDFE